MNELAYLIGLFTIPVCLLVGAARWVGRTLLYASPKFLGRRIELAAEFIDARRAYRFGGRRVWISLVVGRQYVHDRQAVAVLKDQFMPRPEG